VNACFTFMDLQKGDNMSSVTQWRVRELTNNRYEGDANGLDIPGRIR
jgi:hypothetical protein